VLQEEFSGENETSENTEGKFVLIIKKNKNKLLDFLQILRKR
jgi:hypothetical protein